MVLLLLPDTIVGLLDFIFCYEHRSFFFVNQLYPLVVHLLVSSAFSVFVATVRPYRREWGNNIDAALLWLLLTFITSWYYVFVMVNESIPKIMLHVFSCVPLLYAFCLFVWTLYQCTYCVSLAVRRRKWQQIKMSMSFLIVLPNVLYYFIFFTSPI